MIRVGAFAEKGNRRDAAGVSRNVALFPPNAFNKFEVPKTCLTKESFKLYRIK